MNVVRPASNELVCLGMVGLVLCLPPVTAAHMTATVASPPSPVYTPEQMIKTQLTVRYGVVGGGTGFLPPTLTYVHDNITERVSLTSQGTTYDADVSSSWLVSSILNGSSGQERWATTNQNTGIVSGPVSLEFVFQHQYEMNARFGVPDGNSPSFPLLESTSFGIVTRDYLTSSDRSYWLDAGTAYGVNGLLTGSSAVERWISANASGGLATSPLSLNLTYYHQFLISVDYMPPHTQSPGLPLLGLNAFGKRVNVSLNAGFSSFWGDSGTNLVLGRPEVVSGQGERWIINSPLPGSLLSPLNTTLKAAHQYEFTLSYHLVGGGNPPTPSLSGTSFGQGVNTSLSQAASIFWLDSGSLWKVPSLLQVQTNERWMAPSTYEGTVATPLSLNITYVRQYQIQVLVPSIGGEASPATGWYDAGSNVQFAATPTQGWILQGWVGTGPGSYTGGSSVFSLNLTGSIEETPNFGALLSLSAGAWGTVSYYYGDVSGKIHSGDTRVIPISPGANVTVIASPSSFFYTFSGWSGSGTGVNSRLTLSIHSPMQLHASFRVNYVSVAGAIILWAGLVIGIVLFWKNRRRFNFVKPVRRLSKYPQQGGSE